MGMVRSAGIVLIAILAGLPAHAGYTSYGQCIEHNLLLSTNLIRAIQTALKKEGLYSGKIDGILGERMREAIRKRNAQFGETSEYIDLVFITRLLGPDVELVDDTNAKRECDAIFRRG